MQPVQVDSTNLMPAGQGVAPQRKPAALAGTAGLPETLDMAALEVGEVLQVGRLGDTVAGAGGHHQGGAEVEAAEVADPPAKIRTSASVRSPHGCHHHGLHLDDPHVRCWSPAGWPVGKLSRLSWCKKAIEIPGWRG